MEIYARVKELMQPVIERAQLSREEWLEGLARLCLADVRKMFDELGNPIAITELADSEAAAIAAFEDMVVWQQVVTCRRWAAER